MNDAEERPNVIVEREKAQLRVDQFNECYSLGVTLLYLKSEMEGKQKARLSKRAYIQGDSTPVAVLEGIGVAHLDKIEPLPVGLHHKEVNQSRTPMDIVTGLLIGVGLGLGFLPILIASLMVRKNLFFEIWDRMDEFWHCRGWD